MFVGAGALVVVEDRSCVLIGEIHDELILGFSDFFLKKKTGQNGVDRET